MPFFDEVCREHEFLFVILRVIVMKLQTHILVQLRVDWTLFVTEYLHKVGFSDLGMF